MSRLNQEYSYVVLAVLSFLLLVQKSNGFDFKVGGSGSWRVPSDDNAAMYNQWAEKNRFQIGDTLLFVYPADQDSVLHVTKQDYTNCTTASPLEKFADGHTSFKLNQSGPHYFISGVVEHCHKNEKLVVVVMADRNHHNNSNESSKVPAPSPAPAGEESPSPHLPSPEVPAPSPEPAGKEPPSPPPPSPEVPTPSPAPAGEESPSPPPASHAPPPHRNDAASAMIGNLNAAFLGFGYLMLKLHGF